MNKLDLQKKAVDIRKGIISSVHSAKAGHPGGSLSAADAVDSSSESSQTLRASDTVDICEALPVSAEPQRRPTRHVYSV